MADAQERRHFERACRKLAGLLVPKGRKAELRATGDLEHLRSRLSTLAVLVDDEIQALVKEPSRNHALALLLAADFAWQALRTLGERKGDDVEWLVALLPPDHAVIDQEIGDGHYGRQRQIVEDAKWIFDLHSRLRHPATSDADLLGVLREPVTDAARDRLLRAARAVAQVLVCVQVGLDPIVRA